MKSLQFQELLLVSRIEKRARKLQFHPSATILKGPNDTGKSSAIKSIYWTLGAEPTNIHPRWKSADVVSSLRFSIDGVQFRMLRYKSAFSLFDAKDSLIRSFSSVTKELSPYLADLFNFRLQLTSSEEGQQATPAFLYLPFYLDQDGGWTEVLSSFAFLRQFQNWRTDVVHFHTGIRPSEFYDAKVKANLARREADTLKQELDLTHKVLTKIQARMTPIDISLDINSFQAEITALMGRIAELRAQEDELKQDLRNSHNTKLAIEEQISITEESLGELSRDREFAAKQSHIINCPMCHAEYANGFPERLSIALDEGECERLLRDLRTQHQQAQAAWDVAQTKAKELASNLSSLNTLLETRRETITFADIVRREGEKNISADLNADIDTLLSIIGRHEQVEKLARELMKALSDKEIAQKVTGVYLTAMRRLLHNLSVVNISEENYARLDANILETGSDLPRAVLAYFISLARTIEAHSTSTFCPLVIDSPKQQDPDKDNWHRILECIDRERPAKSQLIMALVDDEGYDFGGSRIELAEKQHLLSEGYYKEGLKEIGPLITQSLSS